MEVDTEQGTVLGLRRNGVSTFRDIPYAAAPVGPARFEAPAEHASWRGVRDATGFGPTAPQAPRVLGTMDLRAYFGDGWHRGEDYLTVNIWTPDPHADALPVMVFVHGGGFVAGSGRTELYDGSAFARDGVVFVTVNYRLGIPGFLDVPGAPANRGLLDVVAALRWVRANIARFGGDPDDVTVFGQSAGATIVGGILATPEAEGLFRRAGVQSGNGLGAFSTEQASRVTRAAAQVLGIEPTARAFSEIPDDRLVETASQLAGIDLRTATRTDPLMGLSPFSLVLDVQPADSAVAAVDLLIGTNAEEGNLYLVPVGRYAGSTGADVDDVAARAHPDPARLVRTYREQRPAAGDPEIRAAILGDALFGAGTQALLEARTRHSGAATFVYEFAWRSPALDGELGATHTVELPFVFGRTALPALRGPNRMLGEGEPPASLAALVHDSWVRFAREGDPGWPARTAERRTTMRFDLESGPVDDLRVAEHEVWRRRTPRR
ncbi:carboxylesterase family protein [Lentzea sp. NBRC 102530]|uniref:carboxylesterase/lipase family protein n=1 Tax=Lentzea sp. NBRC 102530 TaxID=3032201 RepID=UPI0024A145AA|nr:carboxylesterase family protein [Lentzea sp. NBRC 102530]GLY50341.1 carboxylic ester hydrolase [Lentzea sp. NBRC 102530]